MGIPYSQLQFFEKISHKTRGGHMKHNLTRLIASSSILGLMTFTLTVLAWPKAPRPAAQPPAARAAGQQKREGEERHPEIRAALRALENAKHHLESAAHDFGGHRVKALEHTEQAIRECHEALEYDRR